MGNRGVAFETRSTDRPDSFNVLPPTHTVGTTFVGILTGPRLPCLRFVPPLYCGTTGASQTLAPDQVGAAFVSIQAYHQGRKMQVTRPRKAIQSSERLMFSPGGCL